MLEKGTIRRKLICYWGFHDWTIHAKSRRETSIYKVLGLILYFLLGAVSGIATLAVILANDTTIFSSAGVIWFSLSLICLLIMPRVFRGHATPFDIDYYDATCIYCHKDVTYEADMHKKEVDDREYRKALIEVALESRKDEKNA